MPVVYSEGADYYADLTTQCFREVKGPRVYIPFESPIGQDIAREIHLGDLIPGNRRK